MGQTPIFILKEGTTRERGKGAQSNNIAAARAVADAVRSTLGPKGMDKMLVDSLGDVVITNDGATILKELDIEHPAAKMIVEVAKSQDQECGDGTTTAVVLAGELLKRAEELVEQNVHQTIITNGYRIAAAETVTILGNIAHNVKPTDRAILRKIAETAMTGKNTDANKEMLGKIVVEAVTAVAEEKGKSFQVDLNNIKVEKKHGAAVTDTGIIQGIIVDKEPVHPSMPRTVKNAKIALLDTALEIKKTEIDAKIEITDPTQLQMFLDEEEKGMRKKADMIAKTGANVVICQKGIDDLVQYYLSKAGVMAIRRAKKSDMEKLGKATGARVVSNLNDFSKSDLGKAGLVETRKIGDDDMTFITGCKKAKAVSILIRGGTEHVIDEIERSVHDALSVVGSVIEDGKAVAGGGAPEVEIALRLREKAAKVGGKEQLAIEAFATAMEVIPRTLAENAGLDSINVLVELRNAHEKKGGNKNAGIEVYDGKVKDMWKMKVMEPFRVKKQAVESASEVATMVLRIDDVIASKSGGGGGGMPPDMGGMGGMGGMPPGMM